MLKPETSLHLEVAAGQDGHPLLPLQDMDDATSPAHLCCQGGSDRLSGPASFTWVSHSNSRSRLYLVMAWSRSWGERGIQIHQLEHNVLLHQVLISGVTHQETLK